MLGDPHTVTLLNPVRKLRKVPNARPVHMGAFGENLEPSGLPVWQGGSLVELLYMLEDRFQDLEGTVD